MSSISKFKVTTAMREILLASSEIKALIGDKIFPIVATEGTKGDFIVYQRDEYSQDLTKMGRAGEDCKVFLFAVSEDYKRSQDLAAVAKDVLEGRYSDPTMEIWMEDSTEIYEDNKYKQVLLFNVI